MAKEIEVLDEEETKKSKKKKKVSVKIALVFFLISLITSGFLIYNIFKLSGIEDIIRYIIIGVLGIIDLVCLIKMIKKWKGKKSKKEKKKQKESKSIGFITFLIIYSLLTGALGGVIQYFYGTVDSINKKYVTYSSSLVVLKDNEAKKAKDLKNYKIGILKDKKSPEGYIIPQEIIKEDKLKDNNKIVKYESYTEMITDLYAKEVDAIFLTTDYPTIYSSIAGYEQIANETKIIETKEKKMKKSDTSTEETASSGKSVTEPFTILLMGIDSTDEILTKNAIANGDSLILITFNPKTLNVTMLSIPRDTYVPIACWASKDENKITHAAAYGTDCMMNTIENYFDVNIDYYAKINFKGLVKLVDALGGIDVDVPQNLCTDDSSRGQQICIKEGRQHLNGEEALVLSRNRKQLVNGDFGRGQNQQLVIQAMVEKIKELRSVNQFTSVLNTVSNSLDTNLTTKQILSFYSVAKDIVKTGLSTEHSNIVNIQQLYLEGQGAMIYDKRMKMTLYDYVPNTYSKNDIVKAMKENLGQTTHKTVKSFSFSINEPYEKKVIGSGSYKSTYNASKYKSSEDDDTKSTTKKTETKKSVIYGCTDPTASNYNSSATDDDGSCKKKSTITPTPDPVTPNDNNSSTGGDKDPSKGDEKPGDNDDSSSGDNTPSQAPENTPSGNE